MYTLDQIADETTDTPIDTLDVSHFPEVTFPEYPNHRAPLAPVTGKNSLYRGHARPVDSSTLNRVLETAGLNWGVARRPVLIQGMKENRTFPGRVALVRTDTGKGLDIVSDRFKVHQNAAIIGGLTSAANAADIKITHGGCLDDGARVFLHGSVNRSFEIPSADEKVSDSYYGGTYSGERNKFGQRKGDVVRLDFRFSGGHKPGFPSVIQSVLMRLACLNGMTTETTMSIRVTHRQEWKNEHTAQIREFVERSIEQLKRFEGQAGRLARTPFNANATKAYAIELFQPELLTSIAANRDLSIDQILSTQEGQSEAGRRVLDSILRSDDVDRSVKHVLATVDSQPGADLARGSAWNAFNAVTYYVDHVRGKGDGSAAVESAMSGDGAKLKSNALELAMTYADRLQVQ